MMVGLCVMCLPAATALAAEPVSNYRNDGSGVFADARPPLKWNATTTAPANVLWRVPLPGPAETSQPVIGGDRIYVQSVPFTLTCLDKMTGKMLWQRERHADDKAARDSEEEKAARLERYVLFCEREIIGRFGSMKAVAPGRPLSLEERYQDAIWFRRAANAPNLDPEKVEQELAAITPRIPETWPGSNAHVALADNYGYTNYTGIASPVTDGGSVWAHFATGEVVCYDRDGRRVWMRLLLNEDGNLPRARQSAAPYQAVTPLLLSGQLYVPRFQGSQKNRLAADLHCLDAATGKSLWVKPMGELGYHGPLALARDGTWYIVTPAGAAFLPDGTRLPGVYGAWYTDGGNAGPSPAIDHASGTVALAMGVRLPAAGKNAPEVLWRFEHGHGWSDERWLAQHVPEGEKPIPLSQRERWMANEAVAAKVMRKFAQPDKRGGVRNFCSPLLYEGLLYHCQSCFKVLSVSDMRDGKLENMFYAEPVPFTELTAQPRGAKQETPFLYTDLALAGGYIFIHGWTETVIVKAGPEFQVVSVNPHEPSMSNLVLDGDRLYLRGLDHLWCLGGPEAQERLPSLKPGAAPPPGPQKPPEFF